MRTRRWRRSCIRRVAASAGERSRVATGGAIVSLAIGVAIDALVRDLFARAELARLGRPRC